jgi:hypothetical protein
MKKVFYLLFIFSLSSCASLSPAGNWDYAITGTPQGDFSGTLTVTKKDKKTFSAVMKSKAEDLKFNKFTFEPKSKKSTGDFDYQGMNVFFDTAINENEMIGNISVQGMSFPFKATRKK